MNTWRYDEGLVLLLWVLRVVLYPFKRTAIHRVDEACQYAMALEEVGKKKGHFVCVLHFPFLVLEKPLPLALQQE